MRFIDRHPIVFVLCLAGLSMVVAETGSTGVSRDSVGNVYYQIDASIDLNSCSALLPSHIERRNLDLTHPPPDLTLLCKTATTQLRGWKILELSDDKLTSESSIVMPGQQEHLEVADVCPLGPVLGKSFDQAVMLQLSVSYEGQFEARTKAQWVRPNVIAVKCLDSSAAIASGFGWISMFDTDGYATTTEVPEMFIKVLSMDSEQDLVFAAVWGDAGRYPYLRLLSIGDEFSTQKSIELYKLAKAAMNMLKLIAQIDENRWLVLVERRLFVADFTLGSFNEFLDGIIDAVARRGYVYALTRTSILIVSEDGKVLKELPYGQDIVRPLRLILGERVNQYFVASQTSEGTNLIVQILDRAVKTEVLLKRADSAPSADTVVMIVFIVLISLTAVLCGCILPYVVISRNPDLRERYAFWMKPENRYQEQRRDRSKSAVSSSSAKKKRGRTTEMGAQSPQVHEPREANRDRAKSTSSKKPRSDSVGMGAPVSINSSMDQPAQILSFTTIAADIANDSTPPKTSKTSFLKELLKALQRNHTRLPGVMICSVIHRGLAEFPRALSNVLIK